MNLNSFQLSIQNIKIYLCTSFFRELSMMHMDALSNFKQEHPQYIFPALYKELFSIDAQQDLLT